MKQVKSLILMLLIPLTMFLGSCSNEAMEEEFVIEADPNSSMPIDQENPFVNVDYFGLEFYKVVGNRDTEAGYYIGDDPLDILVYEGKLFKGDVLRLENLEPGKYYITGNAYKIDDEYVFDVGSITGKSNNMDDEFIVVERGVPTVIKLVVFFHA